MKESFAQWEQWAKNVEDDKNIEKILGIDNIEPIHLIEFDAKDRLNKNEDFSDWYEEELRNFYATRIVDLVQNSMKRNNVDADEVMKYLYPDNKE